MVDHMVIRLGKYLRILGYNAAWHKAVHDRVHPNVYAHYQEFTTWPHCGTVFWKGSHVRNTCRKPGLTSG